MMIQTRESDVSDESTQINTQPINIFTQWFRERFGHNPEAGCYYRASAVAEQSCIKAQRIFHYLQSGGEKNMKEMLPEDLVLFAISIFTEILFKSVLHEQYSQEALVRIATANEDTLGMGWERSSKRVHHSNGNIWKNGKSPRKVRRSKSYQSPFYLQTDPHLVRADVIIDFNKSDWPFENDRVGIDFTSSFNEDIFGISDDDSVVSLDYKGQINVYIPSYVREQIKRYLNLEISWGRLMEDRHILNITEAIKAFVRENREEIAHRMRNPDVQNKEYVRMGVPKNGDSNYEP